MMGSRDNEPLRLHLKVLNPAMENQLKLKQTIPVSTRLRFDVHTTSITLKRRRMDAKQRRVRTGI